MPRRVAGGTAIITAATIIRSTTITATTITPGTTITTVTATGIANPAFAAPNCTIRLIHYPPHPDPEDNEFGFAPHTDNNFLTFLAQSALPGLEVRTAEGEWIRPPAVPGTFAGFFAYHAVPTNADALAAFRARPGAADPPPSTLRSIRTGRSLECSSRAARI